MDRILLNNKFTYIDSTREDTVKYLKENNEKLDKIRTYINVYKEIFDLIPETLEKLFSGHIFPYSESVIELENSLQFCIHGFYKSSLIALRNCLELGLLLIYYDRDDNSEQIIKGWLHSQEKTPFKNEIIKKLVKNKNINMFNQQIPIITKISNLYTELSGYVHTRGFNYSTYQLNNANVNYFVEKSLLLWLNNTINVIEYLSILFLLKYPIGILYTPIEEKFGFNGPAGGFLDPYQSLQIMKLYDLKIQNLLKNIANNDPTAKKIEKAINEMPDISNEEFENQIDEVHFRQIKENGYNYWYNHLLEPLLKEEYHSNKRIEKYIIWAKQNDYYF